MLASKRKLTLRAKFPSSVLAEGCCLLKFAWSFCDKVSPLGISKTSRLLAPNIVSASFRRFIGVAINTTNKPSYVVFFFLLLNLSLFSYNFWVYWLVPRTLHLPGFLIFRSFLFVAMNENFEPWLLFSRRDLALWTRFPSLVLAKIWGFLVFLTDFPLPKFPLSRRAGMMYLLALFLSGWYLFLFVEDSGSGGRPFRGAICRLASGRVRIFRHFTSTGFYELLLRLVVHWKF